MAQSRSGTLQISCTDAVCHAQRPRSSQLDRTGSTLQHCSSSVAGVLGKSVVCAATSLAWISDRLVVMRLCPSVQAGKVTELRVQGALQILAALEQLQAEQRSAANGVLSAAALAGLPELQGYPAVATQARDAVTCLLQDSRCVPNGAAIAALQMCLSACKHFLSCLNG